MKEWRKSTSLERFKAFVRLMRPRHTGQIVGIVTLFTIASHGASAQSLWAIISSLFLSVGIYLLDDAHDCESDRIIHPQRPLPEGYITVHQAYAAGAILVFASISLASMLLFYQFAIFLALAAISVSIVLFNIKSALRALLTALIIGGWLPFSAFPDLKIVLFGLTVALPHFGGSIAKDFLHSRGDKIQGLTPPQDWVRYLASAAFFIAGAILWLPPILDLVTWLYIPPIVFTAASCVILGVDVLKGRYEKVYVYGAIGMCSSLAAFLLEGIHP